MANPKTTIYLPPGEMEYLKAWAASESRSVPNLITIFIREAITARKEGRR